LVHTKPSSLHHEISCECEPPQLPGLQDGIQTSLIVKNPYTKLEKRQGVRDGLKDSLLPTRLRYHHHPTLSFFLSLPCPLLYKAPLRFTSPHLVTISSHFNSTIYFLSLFRYLFITSTTSSSLVEARKGKKRVRLDSDEFSESDSTEVKRLREDLLGFPGRHGARSDDSGNRLGREEL
jgi:hypothetical protein